MQKSSQMLNRAQSALRLIASLDEESQQKLAAARAELELIGKVLNRLEPELCRSAIIDVLENSLQTALESIDNQIQGTS